MRRKWIAALVCMALMLCALPQGTLGEQPHSLTLVLLNDWVVVQAGTTVYRDSELTQSWGMIPEGIIVQRRYDLQNGRTAVVNGKYLGYVASDRIAELREGDWLCAARNTRAYQKPSLQSRWIGVNSGLAMQLVAVNGACAAVRRGNVVAHMYIGHLKPIPWAYAVST